MFVHRGGVKGYVNLRDKIVFDANHGSRSIRQPGFNQRGGVMRIHPGVLRDDPGDQLLQRVRPFSHP